MYDRFDTGHFFAQGLNANDIQHSLHDRSKHRHSLDKLTVVVLLTNHYEVSS